MCLFGAALKSNMADVIQWNSQGFPAFNNSFNYINGSLIIPKDGVYFLFSKVSLKNCSGFKHEVTLNTLRYGKPIVIMMDRYTHIHIHTSVTCNIST